MPLSKSKPARPVGRRPSCASESGTAVTSGQRRRTTCDVSQEANRLVDVARVWLRVGGLSASKGIFIDAAVAELTRRLMRENPGFKLPPGVSLDFMLAIEANNPNGGNS